LQITLKVLAERVLFADQLLRLWVKCRFIKGRFGLVCEIDLFLIRGDVELQLVNCVEQVLRSDTVGILCR